MLVNVLSLALTLGVDLVYANLLVPARHCKEICGTGEGKIRDCILRRLRDLDVFGQIALSVGCARG